MIESTATTRPEPGDVVLTLRPEPRGPDGAGADPMVRLRALLKSMLRAYRWRCVRIEVSGETTVNKRP